MPRVKYVPGDGDSAVTIWNGVKFRAGEWVDLDDKKHVVRDVPEMVDETDKDGNHVKRVKMRHIPMSELARTNQFFEVEGDAPAEEKRRGRPKTPETAEDYLSYAARWIEAADNRGELHARWKREQALRERLGAADAIAEQLYDQLTARSEALKEAA